jgi:hypothetical protein
MFERLIEGPPKPKARIRNPKTFVPGGPKWGMACSVLMYMGDQLKVIIF